MTGRYLTELGDVCRAAGLTVIEVDGWQTRARGSGGYAGSAPWCVMWHHTASQTSAANDVAYIVNGSPDAPIANLYLARDGAVHVCAAGATNTNGKGGPLTVSRGMIPLDRMNEYAIGIEAGNNGVGEIWPAVQIDAFFTLSNALADAYGLEPDDCASHAEWAPTRKIDPATAAAVQGNWSPRSINSSGTWNVDDLRNECITRAIEPPIPPPERGIMFTMFQLASTGDTLGGYMDANGIFAQVTWLSPTRANACSAAGAMNLGTLADQDLANCDLLGPIPPGVSPATFANVIG